MNHSTYFLLLFITFFIIETFGNNKQNPFINDKIKERRNDPNRNTITDEFLVFFNEDCLDKKNSTQRDVIQEFLDLYECYSLNKEDRKTKKFRNIGDYWIVLNKKEDCNDDDEKELDFDDYCIVEVEEDEEIYLSSSSAECTSRTVESALWNLEQASPDISGVYYVEYNDITFAPFDILVMDSGIEPKHSQFQGVKSITRIFDPYPTQSLHYHGTHVAGTIFGKDYGVFRAKGTGIRVIDVRLFGISGSTDSATVLNGYDSIIDYLSNNPNSTSKTIINHSWSGPNSAEKEARIQMIKSLGGIQFAAAGNDYSDASVRSPASSNATITVGNHDENNDRRSSSNYGDLVDIWGPGTNILSALLGNSSGTLTGTSMSSPFLAGIGANILANNPDFEIEDILQRILDFSVYDVDDLRGNTNLPRAQISCEEYCGDDGICGGNGGVCEIDDDCGWSFVCDNSTKLCERDCDTFDIDGFLDCSILFGNAKGNLTAAANEIGGIGQRIYAFQNESNDLQKEINETYRKIKKLSKSYRKQLNKQNANNNPMEQVINDNNDNNNFSLNNTSLRNKDVFIIGLLMINIITMIYFCLCGRKNNDKSSHKQLQSL